MMRQTATALAALATASHLRGLRSSAPAVSEIADEVRVDKERSCSRRVANGLPKLS